MFRLFDIVFDGEGTAVPSDQRDGAVGTAIVAAVGNTQIRRIAAVDQFAVLAVSADETVFKKLGKQFRQLFVFPDCPVIFREISGSTTISADPPI